MKGNILKQAHFLKFIPVLKKRSAVKCKTEFMNTKSGNVQNTCTINEKFITGQRSSHPSTHQSMCGDIRMYFTILSAKSIQQMKD